MSSILPKARLTTMTVIRELRTQFYRSTVARDLKYEEEKEEQGEVEQPGNIDKELPFQAFIFQDIPTRRYED